MSQDYEVQTDTNEVKTITVLVVEPMKAPYVKEIPKDLESMQREVGGEIEGIMPFDESAELVLNANGKIWGLPLNRGLYDEKGQMYDIIMGTFLVVGTTEDAYGSLTQEQIDHFMKKYQIPEVFVNCGERIISAPAYSLEPQGDKEKDTPKKVGMKGKKLKRRKTEHER